MDTKTLRSILAAIALLIFQIAVLNQVHILGVARPFVYPLIILVLPFDTNRAGVLGLAFAIGLILDSFTDTPGLHAAALVLVAWLRPHIADMLTPKAGYESGDNPRIASLGPVWFVTYAGTLLAAHHAAYFFLEVFSLAAIGTVLLHTLVSLLFSLSLAVLFEYLFGPPLQRKSLSR